jgi:hypothetical protein
MRTRVARLDLRSDLGFVARRVLYVGLAASFRPPPSGGQRNSGTRPELLEERGLSFTTFETDATDRQTGVWDKVFFNLQDYGAWFEREFKAVPTPYGPILFILRPTALSHATDVAICLRSAGGRGFDREQEALGSVADVDRIFKYPVDADTPWKADLKTREALEAEFPGAREPEVSCTVVGGVVPWSHVERVVVDPYVLAGAPLEKHVSQVLGPAGPRVSRRWVRSQARWRLYDELAELIGKGATTLDDVISGPSSEPLKEWARQIRQRDLAYQ